MKSVSFKGVELRQLSDNPFRCDLLGQDLLAFVFFSNGGRVEFLKDDKSIKTFHIESFSNVQHCLERKVIIRLRNEYFCDSDACFIVGFQLASNADDFVKVFQEFIPKEKNICNNSDVSLFDRRTESSSSVQYFQFYSYLSQQQNMMQDYVRTSTYQRAILANASGDFAGKVVLDVGAGSGILSFFAIQAGAKRVYAVEASNMAGHCNTLVQANKLAGRIVVISGKIEDIRLPEPVDVIISEPMGYMLYNERMLESYVHSRKFLAPHLRGHIASGSNSSQSSTTQLRESCGDDEKYGAVVDRRGIMFPTVAQLYVVPFSDEALFAEQNTKANFWCQQSFHGMDLSHLRSAAVTEYFNQPVVDTFDIGLCPALPCVHKIDFRTVQESELAVIEVPLRYHITTCATIHGLAFWFDVGFLGSQKDVWLSTAPTEPLTHWYQVRCLLGTVLFVQTGQLLTGRLLMTANSRQSYDVEIELMIPGSETKIRNRLDLKNPHFRYTGYPPPAPPGSHSRPPTESYYASTNQTGSSLVAFNGALAAPTSTCLLSPQDQLMTTPEQFIALNPGDRVMAPVDTANNGCWPSIQHQHLMSNVLPKLNLSHPEQTSPHLSSNCIQ